MGGFVAPGFEAVAEEFERNFVERGEVGAAFAAMVDGQAVADLWGGLASREADRAWSGDTLIGIFSGTKGIVATALLILIDRGQLELDSPVCAYWPEFAANGKDRILVRHAVSHQAGIPGLASPVSIAEATDDVRMAELVAAQSPVRPPGEPPQYHALTFGWLCGELVRRIDGRSVGRFVREEIAEPLELELWIGLPERLEGRVAALECGPGFAADEALTEADRGSDPLTWSIWANPPRFAGGELAANLRSWRAAEIPASNGVVSARSLARLYACLANGGALEGVRLVSEQTVELAQRRLAAGRDPILDAELAFSVGFELQTSERYLGAPENAFGFCGAGGSVAGAWPTLGTGFSYAPNLLNSLGERDPRAAALLSALHAGVAERRTLEPTGRAFSSGDPGPIEG